MTIEKQSPCKVNLLLNILGKRSDGFHELETLMHPVSLCDTLRFTRNGTAIELTCSDPTLPVDSSNLVYKAAAEFFRAAEIKEGVRIHLEKRIPMAAGLGGGSGNAASTLLALNEFFGEPIGFKKVEQIAASLGSDVPFFLQDGPALAFGRGEKIESLPPFPALEDKAFLLIHPGFGIATAWAYQQLAHTPEALTGKPGRARTLATLLQKDDLKPASNNFYNSLEIPALRKFPILEIYQQFLREHGALATLMSGSGSTTFCITDGEDAGRSLEKIFREKFGNIWTAVVAI